MGDACRFHAQTYLSEKFSIARINTFIRSNNLFTDHLIGISIRLGAVIEVMMIGRRAVGAVGVIFGQLIQRWADKDLFTDGRSGRHLIDKIEAPIGHPCQRRHLDPHQLFGDQRIGFPLQRHGRRRHRGIGGVIDVGGGAAGKLGIADVRQSLQHPDRAEISGDAPHVIRRRSLIAVKVGDLHRRLFQMLAITHRRDIVLLFVGQPFPHRLRRQRIGRIVGIVQNRHIGDRFAV